MSEKLKALFSKDRYFYGLLIILIIFIGQLPIILHRLHTPEGYYYPLLDRTAFSDYYYLGVTRYGMGQEWLLKIPYVIYDHQASLIQFFFIILGKISLMTRLGPAEVFAAARVTGGLIYLLSAVFLFKKILSPLQAKLAFILFLIIEPLPALDFFSRTGSDFDNWVWHFGEAARRFSVMPPHYTFGKGLTVFSAVFFILYLKNHQFSKVLISSLLIFIAGLIYPPPVFIVLFSLTVASVFGIFARGPLAVLQGVPFKKLVGISLYLIASIMPLVILKHELARGYPWDMWNKVELGWNSASMQFEWAYIRLLGIAVYLVPFAVLSIAAQHKKDLTKIFILTWFLSSFLLFPFGTSLKLGKFRFIEGAQIVPFAILVLWGIEYLAQIITHYKNQKTASLFKKAAFSFLILYFLIFTALQARWSTFRLWPYWKNVYFRPEELQSLQFLKSNTRKDAVILADTFSSNFIPAFVSARTILGFPDFYPQSGEFRNDEITIQEILKEKLKEKEAANFFRNRKVEYVYCDLSIYGERNLYPNLMDKIYQNNLFKIYKVKPGLI